MAKNFFNDRDVKRIGKMLRWYETQTGAGAGGDAAGSRGKNEPSITFYNDSGETIPPYSIVELQEGGQIGDNIPYVKAVKPTANGDKYGVNGAVQVESKKYGQAYVSGKCWFAYDTGTPAIGDKYGPDTGLWPATLDGIPGFIECLGIIDSTNKFALGVIGGGGGGDSIIGKLDGAITATGSATLSIWSGTAGSEADSGNNETVYNWAAGALDSGEKVVATKINGYYYLTGILPKTTQITVQTAEQWDGTAHKLQNKTRTAKVIDPGTESGWTDIDTAACATACT